MPMVGHCLGKAPTSSADDWEECRLPLGEGCKSSLPDGRLLSHWHHVMSDDFMASDNFEIP